MSPPPTMPSDITLRVLSGPYGDTFFVHADGPAMIGRAVGSEVCLLHEGVSRRHASFVRRDGTWYVMDQGSTHGSFLNGVKLGPNAPTAIAGGDLLRIGPWTFRVLIGRSGATTAATVDDPGALIQPVEIEGPVGLAADGHGASGGAGPRGMTVGSVSAPGAGRRLRLLTECIMRLGQADGEESLARMTLESVMHGSGYTRGAVLRPIDDGREVTVLASMRADDGTRAGNSPADFPLSRSLIQAAAKGQTVMLSRSSSRVTSESIVDLGIHSAICAPVFLGEAVAAFLYLDARGQESSVQADAASFCEAVASAYGLAVANLKRAELDRRQRSLTAELSAAHDAQQFILPPAEGDHGFLSYAMHMRPGVFVAGDLFDVVPLQDGRVAICLGDVAGHGAGSAMLMATVQAHLHANIRHTGDPASAVQGVNQYLCERNLTGRFVSLWLGVFSPDGLVQFVDCGHGYWIHKPAAAAARSYVPQGGIPLGIEADEVYSAMSLNLGKGDRIVVYSDGLLEQRNPAREQFGLARLDEAVNQSASAGEDVRRIFDAVLRFAARSSLDDDATAASIEYRGVG